MKCIRCQHDCKYRDRRDKTCPNCKGKFAFEPREGDWMTDSAFQRAIDQVSAEGQVRWGFEHLYYEVMRRLRYKSFHGFLVKLFFVDPKLVRYTTFEFEQRWTRWVAAHGIPEGFIERRKQPAPELKLESDIGDYSFDRAVICDRARTVDVLLANNFHFENNCAVLSIDGYPPGPFATVRKMLQRNPKLKVFALHDCTADGCRLATRIAKDPEWFGGKVPVIDVGLRPNHAASFHGNWIRAPRVEFRDGDGIAQAERLWLTKYQFELAAIRPEQILKRLFRAMNKQFDPRESTDFAEHDAGSRGSDGAIWTESESFGTDASDSDGGGDSFG